MSNKDDELLEVLNILKEEERKEQEHPNIEEKRSSKLKKFIKERFSIKKIKERVKENKIEYIISIFMIVYMILTIILNIKVVYYHSGTHSDCHIDLDSQTESNTTSTSIIDILTSDIAGYYEYENIVLSKNKIIVYIIQAICIIGICIIPKNNKKSFICIIVLFVVCNAIIFNIAVQKEITLNIYDGFNSYKNIYGITIKRAY